MLNKHKLAIALGFLALIGTIEVAQARYVSFGGTRSQVRNACSGPGRHLTEGVDHLGAGWTSCTDLNRGTNVTCDDGGDCAGYVPRLGGFRPKAQPKPRVPRNYEPPQSLSESSDSTPIDAPPVDPVTDVVIIN